MEKRVAVFLLILFVYTGHSVCGMEQVSASKPVNPRGGFFNKAVQFLEPKDWGYTTPDYKTSESPRPNPWIFNRISDFIQPGDWNYSVPSYADYNEYKHTGLSRRGGIFNRVSDFFQPKDWGYDLHKDNAPSTSPSRKSGVFNKVADFIQPADWGYNR